MSVLQNSAPCTTLQDEASLTSWTQESELTGRAPRGGPIAGGTGVFDNAAFGGLTSEKGSRHVLAPVVRPDLRSLREPRLDAECVGEV